MGCPFPAEPADSAPLQKHHASPEAAEEELFIPREAAEAGES